MFSCIKVIYDCKFVRIGRKKLVIIIVFNLFPCGKICMNNVLQVDMTKVSMDVIRPWIANRVTELLGFEDEVLINFIYGLLDGKVI